MNNVQYAYHVAVHVIDQHIVSMSDQLARASHTPESTAVRIVDQQRGLLGKQFIESQRDGRVVGLNAVVNVVAVLYCLWRSEQLHQFDPSSRRRVAARRAANRTSTSAAGTRLPASAEAFDRCTLPRSHAPYSAASCCCFT